MALSFMNSLGYDVCALKNNEFRAMGLGKQAKTLTKRQVAMATSYLSQTRYVSRNRVILLLSVKAGLRAKEIAVASLWVGATAWPKPPPPVQGAFLGL